ncbi:MAG: hypothetical protein HOV84_13615, partial [Streptomyces sp.]|nr:hypothetical protein [Streptomyces sp.]
DPAGARALAALTARDEAVRHLAELVREPADSPDGRSPEGRTPEGQAPEGRSPEGQTPEGRSPEGRVVGSLLHMVCNRLFGGESARELTVLGIARGAVQDNFHRRSHAS